MKMPVICVGAGTEDIPRYDDQKNSIENCETGVRIVNKRVGKLKHSGTGYIEVAYNSIFPYPTAPSRKLRSRKKALSPREAYGN